MNRVLRVARLHITSWPSALGWPVGILLLAFLFNVAFWAAMGDEVAGPRDVTGGLMSIYFVQLVFCAQAVTQMFSFSVGLNVSRRTFFAGTGLVILGQVIAFSLMLYGFLCLELATNGWGLRLSFFNIASIMDGYSPQAILVYAVPMALMSAVGLFLGVVFKRWGNNGVWTLTVLSTVVFGGAAVLITLAGAWTSIGSWLVGQPLIALVAAWPLALVAALAGGTYGIARRVVP